MAQWINKVVKETLW